MRGPKPTDPVLRFWRFVKKTAGCWGWTGSLSPAGYARMGIGSETDGTARIVFAHRFAWELRHGPIPSGLEVCHHCDNPVCTRPDHLFLGTHKDNMADSARKGRARGAEGEAHHKAKMTWEKVNQMRRLYAAGGIGTVRLGRMFGIGAPQAYNIVAGINWKRQEKGT